MGRFLRSNRGFSLIELLAVVAIIGILAVIGIPQYQNFRYRAFQAEAKGHLNAINVGEKVFFLEHQGYHSSLSVIGFAPHGRTRYNVGFGDVGTIVSTYTAITPADDYNSKNICGGAFGAGTDAKCNMFVPTPDIAFSATVTTSTYYATAVAYNDSLIASSGYYPSPVLTALNLALGSSAFAIHVIPDDTGGGTTTVTGSTESSPDSNTDSWVIDHTNSLRQMTIKDVMQYQPGPTYKPCSDVLAAKGIHCLDGGGPISSE